MGSVSNSEEQGVAVAGELSSKRKAADSALELLDQQLAAKRMAADFKVPPSLTVDVPAVDQDEPPELPMPRTPANVRSVQRTELHRAVSSGDLGAAEAALERNAAHGLQRDEHGWTPLHNAAALPNAEARRGLVGMLLGHSIDLNAADNAGYTCVHWAAACGHVDVLDMLLEAGADPRARSKDGETPLHRACRLGRLDAVSRLAAAGGVEALRQPNDWGETPLDAAGKLDGRVHKAARGKVRRMMLDRFPMERLLVLHHADCLEHNTGETHQEHPRRVECILCRLLPFSPRKPSPPGRAPPGRASNRAAPVDALPLDRGGRGGLHDVPDYEVRLSSDFPPASLGALRRAHDASYVALIESMSRRMLDGPPTSPVPLTPLVQRAHGASHIKDGAVSDTRFSAGTHAAARRAAGAVVHAVEQVLNRACHNAACIVRPPGHHAGWRGLREGTVSCGFCVFNSVMVGAMHALQAPRGLPMASPKPRPPHAPPPAASPIGLVPCLPPSLAAPAAPAPPPPAGFGAPPPPAVRRVAIIDFDVHHGDGTEEIVKHLCSSLPPDALFFASIHLYDPGDDHIASFYPSSGATNHLRANVINVPILPLWRRAAPHSAGRAPSRAARSPEASQADAGNTGGGHGPDGGAAGAPAQAASAGAAGSGASPRPTGAPVACGRLEWRAAFAQRIIPALRAYGPHLILLSSGFDGGVGDIGNSKLDAAEKYHQGLDLTPADFEWMTEQVMSVAATCCPGRVVSVLEGGYGRYVPTKLTESGWVISPDNLSNNCLAHVTALSGLNPRPRLD